MSTNYILQIIGLLHKTLLNIMYIILMYSSDRHVLTFTLFSYGLYSRNSICV